MNINKFLCETFDSKKKGYITIKDIILDVRVVILFIYSWFSGLIIEIYTTTSSSMTLEYFLIKPLLFGIPLLAIFYILIYIVFKIIDYIIVPILEIKILKCSLKEDDKN